MNRRSDYTFRYNEKLGRHGWLRLTPAYSVKLVEEILSPQTLFTGKIDSKTSILDPFCGTATTGIVASENGLNCTLYEINPFLTWFGSIKALNFTPEEIQLLYQNVCANIDELNVDLFESYWIPPMKNIERWWDAETLCALSCIRTYISNNWGEPSNTGIHNLLWVAFARLCIESSAADYNHISVSFKENPIAYNFTRIKKMYTDIISMIISSLNGNGLKGSVTIINEDSRELKGNSKFDLVITSPPYPNRISYIRELRPYMYWLKFLSSGEQAGELDWKAIGGTWGSATSKLHTWSPISQNLPNKLLDVCSQIEQSDAKNGKTMSLYVHKFFDDLNIHLSNLRNRLNNGAHLYYILGNSSFYKNHVDTESFTMNILKDAGYSNIHSKIIRKRNSKSELFEYMIEADWLY